jgi:HEPN domain-containing protein
MFIFVILQLFKVMNRRRGSKFNLPILFYFVLLTFKVIDNMREEIEILLKRAGVFKRDAENDLKNKDFDICMFHLEQVAQLLIKAKLLEIKGSFQRTHSLRMLLLELAESWKKEEIKNFIEENKEVLRDLERAYISSRYIYEEFFEEEVKRAFEVVEKLKEMLWKG